MTKYRKRVVGKQHGYSFVLMQTEPVVTCAAKRRRREGEEGKEEGQKDDLDDFEL